MVRTTNERVSTDSGDSSRLRRRAERLKFGLIARAQHRPVGLTSRRFRREVSSRRCRLLLGFVAFAIGMSIT